MAAAGSLHSVMPDELITESLNRALDLYIIDREIAFAEVQLDAMRGTCSQRELANAANQLRQLQARRVKIAFGSA